VNPGRLDGKRTLITGAAGGIGRATAAAFAREGALVALVGLDERELSELRDELAAQTGRDARDFPVLPGDVSESDDVERYFAEAAERFGGLDVLFNNAGIEGLVQPIQDYDDGAFERVMRVNVRGAWLNLKRAIRAMIPSRGGSIVNTASGGALRGLPYMSAYVASKHAVLGMTRSAAVELGGSGIRVNAVCPGPVRTRMMESLAEQRAELKQTTVEESHRAFAAPIPMARYAEADEVAETVTFLASDAAAFVTGTAIPIDGGRSAV
jgi:NAD(P)-dependent dehydrogenase (short-subunit alcohol dehydrogenase family)